MRLPDIRGIINSALRIYNCPESLRTELFALLRFDNPDYLNAQKRSPWASTAIPEHDYLVADYPDYVEVPRGFDPLTLSRASQLVWNRILFEDCRAVFNVKFPELKLALNRDQEQICTKFRHSLAVSSRPYGTFLFVAPTSAGKTMAQAAAASKTGQRTLVLCKTNLIKKAWQDDLFKLYGIDKHALGEIQQTNFRIGNHFTLASIATLTRRKHLWAELFSQVGCLIIDEVQITGSKTVREIVSSCPARYIIGMTATDNRRDGKNYVIQSLLGPRLLKIFNKQQETESSLPLSDARVVRTNYRYLDKKGEPIPPDLMNFAELTQQMSDDPVRNAIIVAEVKKDWEAGHCPLVVTTRVAHAITLVELLRKEGVVSNLLTGATNGDKEYSEQLVNSILARHTRCLVATTQAIKLGANLNPLDRLHLAIPPANKDDVEQLVGRIRRKAVGKTDAHLVWYHDIMTPYWHSKFKKIFYATMRTLRVPRFENMYVA